MVRTDHGVVSLCFLMGLSLSLSPSLSLSLFFLGALTLAGCRPARRSLKNRYIVPEIMLNLQNIIKA